MEGGPQCDVYDDTNNRYVVTSQPCPSPMTLPFELADGYYDFSVWQYDKAYNSGYYWQEFEVDTVAPNVLTNSVKPTGRRVSPYASVTVTFDDNVYDSAQFVNIQGLGLLLP